MSMNSDKQILVTGGSGFLGGGIVKALKARHPTFQISVLDSKPPPDDVRKCLIQFIQADITNVAEVNNAFAGYSPDLVIHTAGMVPARQKRYSTSHQDWVRVKSVNYDGTRHILDAAMAAGCMRFVYTSSCTTVIDDLDHDYFNMNETIPLGHATLHYGKSKALAEQYVLDSKHAARGLLACALRPCTIIGEGDTAVISLIHDLIAKGETSFIIGSGDNIYDFMYISNAVDAHCLAVENLFTSTHSAAGHAFFISNQEPVYFWDFFAYVWAQFGHVPRRRWYVPVQLAWFAAAVAEVVTWCTGGASTLDRGSVKDAVRTQYASNAKAREILGYEPRVPMAEGVRRWCEDYKRRLERGGNVSRMGEKENN